MAESLTIAFKDHFGKGRPLAAALARAGHRFVAAGEPAELLMLDLDPPAFGYRELIDRYKDMGAIVLLYPHGANPMLVYDGLYEPYERVDGSLVIGPGHAEVLRRIEYPTPTYVTGWSLCEPRPFVPRADVRHVVFAPTHPCGGSLGEVLQEENAEAYRRLCEGSWRLTVRHVGTLEQNGLWPVAGVNYIQGGLEVSFAEIDTADVVVAGDGTYPALAIARGVPTVLSTMDRSRAIEMGYGLPGETPVNPRRPERYRDYIAYPLDMSCGPADEVLHAAARSEASITDFKRRFIGGPLDPTGLSGLIERIVAEGPPAPVLDETRGFTVTAFADELLERPELLAAYARSFGPEDDASLVVWGVGLDAAALLPTVEQAVAAAGVRDDHLPDVLLVPLPGSREADELLAGRSDAVLSGSPGAGRLGDLPRFGAGDVAALRAAAAGLVVTPAPG